MCARACSVSVCVCVCARAAGTGGGAVDWREERPGEGLTARAGEVEATLTGTATARNGVAAQ